jgi:hypothetical protein
LDEWLANGDFGPGEAHRTQKTISAVVDDPWIMATSKDLEYVDCRNESTDPRLNQEIAYIHQFAELIARKSIRSQAVSDVATDVASMSVSQADLGASHFLLLMQQAKELPDLTQAPLRPDELAIANLK